MGKDIERALTITQETGDQNGESHMLTRLGRLAYEDGIFGLAEQLYKQALVLDRTSGRTHKLAADHADLARVYRAQGRYKEAWDFEAQARMVQEPD